MTPFIKVASRNQSGRQRGSKRSTNPCEFRENGRVISQSVKSLLLRNKREGEKERVGRKREKGEREGKISPCSLPVNTSSIHH